MDVPSLPWIHGVTSEFVPGLGIDSLGRLEKWGVLVELEDIAGLEVKPIADQNRNGDLPLGCKSCSHGL